MNAKTTTPTHNRIRSSSSSLLLKCVLVSLFCKNSGELYLKPFYPKGSKQEKVPYLETSYPDSGTESPRKFQYWNLKNHYYIKRSDTEGTSVWKIWNLQLNVAWKQFKAILYLPPAVLTQTWRHTKLPASSFLVLSLSLSFCLYSLSIAKWFLWDTMTLKWGCRCHEKDSVLFEMVGKFVHAIGCE